MEDWLILRLILFFVLLFLSALFSGAEIALFSLSPVQVDMMREKKGAAGETVAKLLESPRKLLVTIYIGNELINVAIAAVSTILALHFFGEYGIAAAVGIGTFMLLVFGDVTPKTFAFRHAQSYSLAAAGPLLWFSKVVYPLQAGITSVTDSLVAMTGESTSKTSITEDEMKTVLEHGEDKGVIEPDEKEMILNIFELGDTTVAEVMTPRAEIFSLPLEEGPDVIARRAILSNYSRIPIYKERPDNLVGILYTRNLLLSETSDSGGNMEKLLREPYIIPPTKKIDELLRDFRKKKIHIAIVVDEYGGLDGLVTLEDILEEVLGEDDDPEGMESIEEIKPGFYNLPGRLPLHDFNEYFNTAYTVEDVDTVGGMVFHLFGRMPKSGESIDRDSFTFYVRKIQQSKISQLTIKVASSEKPDSDSKGEG